MQSSPGPTREHERDGQQKTPGRGTRAAHGRRAAQLPWQTVVNPFAPMAVLSTDQIEAIHHTSLRILEELGIELMSARGRALLRAAGAEAMRPGRCGWIGGWWMRHWPRRHRRAC